MTKLMVLPARDAKAIRVVQIPEDFEEHEAYRHLVSLIAQVEEDNPNYSWEDIASVLEDHQIHPVDFILGPHLD